MPLINMLILVILCTINIAFQGLQSEYNEANGYEGRMLQGKPASSTGFCVQIKEPNLSQRWETQYMTPTHAYRADVVAKLDQSDLLF